MFYWLWHDALRCLPDYDVTEFLKSHPGFRAFKALPPGGPAHPTWYWAQPLFGYYLSTDPWVIRKHLVMLSDAGVDFIFFDFTNADVYDPALTTLLNTELTLQHEGLTVPRLTFFLNYQPDWKIEHLYKHFYLNPIYRSLWFQWDGKPLLMAPRPKDSSGLKDKKLLTALQNYFSYRPTWAFQKAAKEPTKWRFMDSNPQRPALGPNGKVEEMPVSKSLGGPIWKNMATAGVSCVPGFTPRYNDQWRSPQDAKGLFFQYQWKVASKVKPPILLVTGWNEWTASVWNDGPVPFLGKPTARDAGYFVDEFNMDFDRDLEPMKGGYEDDYYMQLLSEIRHYKGIAPPQHASARRTITFNRGFGQWHGITPLYHDAVGDVANRDWAGSAPGTHYVNQSARNDFATAQVARDSKMVYFHITTAEPISPPSGNSWMVLLIDADRNVSTGWHGYDLAVNRNRSGTYAMVEANVDRIWRWRAVGRAKLYWHDHQLELAIPRPLLTRFGAGKHLRFHFKWIDNQPASPHLMDFYSFGDVAPDGRFNYRYP
jgi:hypothetical protein